VAQWVNLPWDLKLDNSTLLDEEAIAAQVGDYLQQRPDSP